jgi:hypothetical protein
MAHRDPTILAAMQRLHHASRGRTALLVSLLLVVLLAGCGGSTDNGVASKSATEILAAAKAAAQSATSVRIISKNAQGPLTLTVNLELSSNAGRGHISGLGVDFEVIRIGGTLYLKGNPTFYQRLGGAAAHASPGAWLKAPVKSGPLAQFAGFTDLPGEVGRLLSTAKPVTKGTTTTTNGQKTVELKQAGQLYTGKIYIATTGNPYPVQITKTGRETGHTTLTNWNQPVSLTAPPSAIEISHEVH